MIPFRANLRCAPAAAYWGVLGRVGSSAQRKKPLQRTDSAPPEGYTPHARTCQCLVRFFAASRQKPLKGAKQAVVWTLAEIRQQRESPPPARRLTVRVAGGRFKSCSRNTLRLAAAGVHITCHPAETSRPGHFSSDPLAGHFRHAFGRLPGSPAESVLPSFRAASDLPNPLSRGQLSASGEVPASARIFAIRSATPLLPTTGALASRTHLLHPARSRCAVMPQLGSAR